MTTHHRTDAAAPTADIATALMSLPYEEWVRMPVLAAQVRDLGMPCESLTWVVRTGRRRGVLRTRKEPERQETLVMRIAAVPRLGAAASTIE